MQFFVLDRTPTGADEAARTDALAVEGTQFGEAPRCNACGAYVGMRRWLPPYAVELETWGVEFGDLAIKSVGTDLLVSEKFKALWECYGLSRLSGFEPVEVVAVKAHLKLRGNLPPYFRAAVSRSQTLVDVTASEFEWDEQPPCQVCRVGKIIKRWKRLVIDEATWTGEDIFVARGLSGSIVVSERFTELCETNGVKNAVFIPAEDFSRDFYPWEDVR